MFLYMCCIYYYSYPAYEPQILESMATQVTRSVAVLGFLDEALMYEHTVPRVGKSLLRVADVLESLSSGLYRLAENSAVGRNAAQRCHEAAKHMVLAGNSLLALDDDDDGSKT